MLHAAGVVERPDERRARIEVPGQLRKSDVIGLHAGHNLTVDAPHRRVVEAQQVRGHFFFARGVHVSA
jgi:hypothetical protein